MEENKELLPVAIPVDCIDNLFRILHLEEEKLLLRLENNIDTRNNNIDRLNKCRDILNYLELSMEAELEEETVEEQGQEETDEERPLGFTQP